MTATVLTRRRALWALLAVVALAVAGLHLASSATSGTTAAWTDSVHSRVQVGLGEWSTEPAPVVSCTVWMHGQPTGETCEASASVTRTWGAAPERFAVLDFDVTSPLPGERYATLTFSLAPAFAQFQPTPGDVPVDGWEWSTSTILSNYPLQAGSLTCDLPVFSATTQTYFQEGTGSLTVQERRQPGAGNCP